jgi:hypothetical protein
VAGTETEGPNSLGNQQEGAGNQGYSGAPGDLKVHSVERSLKVHSVERCPGSYERDWKFNPTEGQKTYQEYQGFRIFPHEGRERPGKIQGNSKGPVAGLVQQVVPRKLRSGPLG